MLIVYMTRTEKESRYQETNNSCTNTMKGVTDGYHMY